MSGLLPFVIQSVLNFQIFPQLDSFFFSLTAKNGNFTSLCPSRLLLFIIDFLNKEATRNLIGNSKLNNLFTCTIRKGLSDFPQIIEKFLQVMPLQIISFSTDKTFQINFHAVLRRNYLFLRSETKKIIKQKIDAFQMLSFKEKKKLPLF